ncbi:MAG: MBL fold metallo-hydrolase [Candidatus Ranarchaeia archaeon]
MVKIHFFGGCREVGGSAILVEDKNSRVLLDCGIYLGEEVKIPPIVNVQNLDGVVVTHAHLDHSGGTPALYVSGKPKLWATPLTLDIMKILISDMVRLNAYMLPYERVDLTTAEAHFEPVFFGKKVKLNRGNSVKIHNSGHIPGSISPSVNFGKKKVLYTSDFNTEDSCMLNGADFNFKDKFDAVICESTYAFVEHPDRRETERKFTESVQETVDQGGTAIIPAFGVARSQEVACVLHRNKYKGPLILDGMGRSVMDYYLENAPYIDRFTLLEKTRKRTKYIRNRHERLRKGKQPGAIVTTAGMLKGGPVAGYIPEIMDDSNNAIFLTGYQLLDTAGRRLLEKGTYLQDGEQRKVSAKVQYFDFSGHAGSEELFEFYKGLKGDPTIFCVHGDEENCIKLAKKIEEETGFTSYAPANNEEYKI